jgi:hypothetical protein
MITKTKLSKSKENVLFFISNIRGKFLYEYTGSKWIRTNETSSKVIMNLDSFKRVKRYIKLRNYKKQ